VRVVLHDHQTFSSAAGIGANDLINLPSIGNTLTSDPPEHTKMRGVIRAPLTAVALKDVAGRIEAEAEPLVERLVAQRHFDAIEHCARHLRVAIASDLVGNMLPWAAATFDALGAMNVRGQVALTHLRELHAYCRDAQTIARHKPDGWAAAIWKAAERGEIQTSVQS